MITSFFRTIIIYLFLVFAMKLGGKRQVGELQLSELITALLLSEIASIPIGHDEMPLSFAIIPVLTLICLEVISAFIVTKSPLFKKLLGGNPSIIINKGKLDLEAMSKLPIGVDELISEARLKGIADISDLEYAILESNGKLAVFEKAKQGEKEIGIAHAVIVDGSVSGNSLKQLGMTKESLEARLKTKRVALKDIFLYTINDAGEEYWVFRKHGNKLKETKESEQ